jgi:ketosteroid isomerase-like protein
MKRVLGAMLFATALILAGTGGHESAYAIQHSQAEQELIQIERDWCAALVKKDTTALARILADDYTSIGSRGIASTKADELANLKGSDSITNCVDTKFKVRIYGDAAVVTGLATRSGTYKGIAFKDRQTFWTDTFIRKDGRWQCVATQGTLVQSQQN